MIMNSYVTFMTYEFIYSSGRLVTRGGPRPRRVRLSLLAVEAGLGPKARLNLPAPRPA